MEISFPLPDSSKRVFELIKEENLLSNIRNQDFDNTYMMIEEEEKGNNQSPSLILKRYPEIGSLRFVNPSLTPGQLAYLSDLNKKFGTDLYLFLIDSKS